MMNEFIRNMIDFVANTGSFARKKKENAFKFIFCYIPVTVLTVNCTQIH